jgi:hypothetical protein
VLDNVKKLAENIKVDCVPSIIVIKQGEKLSTNENNVPTLNNENIDNGLETLKQKIDAEIITDLIRAGKVLPNEEGSPIMGDQTTAPKKGKKTRRHKKHGN